MTNAPSMSARSWLLAIDASTEQASLALFDGVALAELSWPAGRNQTNELLAEISRLAELAGCDVRAGLGCVAVTIGPGMFNGLRVGMSIAKGFALALDAEIVGVPTLQVAAAVFPGDVLAIAAAGRSRLLWQPFHGGEPAGDAINGQFSQLVAELESRPSSIVVTGELNRDQWNAIDVLPMAVAAGPPAHHRRAGALAAIAWRRWAKGEVDDAATLEPVYVHAPRVALV
jgi:tRNA threonylcarbamoyladenosine biosynthesis protein TsaB